MRGKNCKTFGKQLRFEYGFRIKRHEGIISEIGMPVVLCRGCAWQCKLNSFGGTVSNFP